MGDVAADVGDVALVHVPDFGVGVPGGVDLVVPGLVVALQVVVLVLAAVEGVSAGIKRIASFAPCVIHANCSGNFRVRSPQGHVVAVGDSGLQQPVLAQIEAGNNAGLRVRVNRVEKRMGIGVIVRRKLRFNVWQGYVAANTNIETLGDMRNINVDIIHDGVIPIFMIEFQQLLAKNSFGRGVAVVLPVKLRKAETPVHMVGLHRVWQALNIDHLLVRNDAVGAVVIRGGRVRAIALVRTAHIKAAIQPAIDLDA